MSRPEGKVFVDLLKPIKGRVYDCQGAFYRRAVSQTLYVARVQKFVRKSTGLRTRPIARNTFPVHSLLIGGTNSDAGPIVLKQVLRAVLDARRPVGILSIGILFPLKLDVIVPLHWRTFLFAHPVVVKVATCLKGRGYIRH